jgi:hypothetical protein
MYQTLSNQNNLERRIPQKTYHIRMKDVTVAVLQREVFSDEVK